MIYSAISAYPGPVALIVALPIGMAIFAFLCPAMVLGLLGGLCLCGGAGLALAALVSFATPKDQLGLLGPLLGVEAAISAAGTVGLGLALIAASGAIRSFGALPRQTYPD